PPGDAAIAEGNRGRDPMDADVRGAVRSSSGLSGEAELTGGCLVEGEAGGARLADRGQEGVEHLLVAVQIIQVDPQLAALAVLHLEVPVGPTDLQGQAGQAGGLDPAVL